MTSPALSAAALVARLEDEYDLVLSPPNRCNTAPQLFKICHMGNLVRSDFDLLLDALFEILKSDADAKANAAE